MRLRLKFTARCISIVFTLIVISQSASGQDWRTLRDLADSLAGARQYDSAIIVQRQALTKAEEELGPLDTALVQVSFDLAILYISIRDYSGAEPYARKCLSICEQQTPPDVKDLTMALSLVGDAVARQGRISEGCTYMERAAKIRENTPGIDPGAIAAALNNLGNFRARQGRLAEADSLMERAITIMREKGDSTDTRLGPFLSNRGSLLYSLGRYDESEQLLVEALEYKKRVLGVERWSTASSMNHLGSFYASIGKYEKSEDLHRQALAIEEKLFGRNYPSVATTLNCLADLYVAQERYAEAADFMEEALSIWKKSYSENHYTVAKALDFLSTIKRFQGELPEALRYAYRSARIRLSHVRTNSHLMPEKDALAASQEMRHSVSSYIAALPESDDGDDSTVIRAASLILSSKGVISDDMFRRGRTLANETDSTALALMESLNQAKLDLARRYVAGPGPNLDEHRKAVDSLEQLTLQLESELSRRSASFRRDESVRDLDAARLEQQLTRGSALVEYVRYEYDEGHPDSMTAAYLALVLTPDRAPRLAHLGPADEIDQIVKNLRLHIKAVADDGGMATAGDQEIFERLSATLTDLIWKPVRSFLSGRELVFVAPDGPLNFISFAGLKQSDGRYLIEDFALHGLSSGRDVMRFTDRAPSGNGLLAMGDPDYNATASERQTQLILPPDTTADRPVSSTRGFSVGCNALNEVLLGSLPGTRREVETAADYWRSEVGGRVTACLGMDATEDHFKAYAPGSRVILLATHGFYLDEACLSGVDDNRFTVAENPLLRSGLFFAGANRHGEGADSADIEDGVLTAYEVSALDLSGTELAILSGCETGLGEVETGEGVYGLRRAFQTSGVRTLVTAFWPISDHASVDIVTELLHRKERDWPDWMRSLQLRRLEQLRADGKPDHPVNWGAFGIIGDWR